MGATLCDDDHIILPGTGEKTPFFWIFGKRLPRPEDYVLQRSQLTLNDICAAEEWEAVGPQMPPPYAGEAGPGFPSKNDGVRAPGKSERTPNILLSMHGHPNQPTMARRHRRAMDARQRKQAKALAAH